MEIRYKSDLYASYMLIDIPQQINRKQYAFQMLEENLIKGILPAKQRLEEGTGCLYLDITGKKSLTQEYRDKEMDLEDMLLRFQQLISIFDELRNFLLSDKFVLLKPEYLYIDIETEDLSVALLPWEREEQQGLRQLAEFFLEKMNPRDEQGINAAYLFYKQQSQPNFSLYQFMPIIEKEMMMKRQKKREAVQNVEPREEKILSDSAFFEIRNDGLVKEKETKSFEKKASKEKAEGGIWSWFIKRFKKKKRIEPEYDLSPLSYSREESSEEYLGCQETVFFESQEEEWKLEWKEKGRIKTAPLSDFPVTIGKLREEASVVIADKSVSRIHCRFIKQDEGIAVMDMNSMNGTILNGMRLRPGEIISIAKNDEILIGKVRVLVV